MALKTKRERLDIFYTRLREAAPAGSRDAAVALVLALMQGVEDEYSGAQSSDYDRRMNFFPLTGGGWNELNGDPCFWQDSTRKFHKTFIYNSGRIRIERQEPTGVWVVDLDKPGAPVPVVRESWWTRLLNRRR